MPWLTWPLNDFRHAQEKSLAERLDTEINMPEPIEF
jgi:hypothetical protein